MRKVVLAARIHPDAVEALEKRFRVVMNPYGRKYVFEWLCEELGDAWGLIVTPRIPVTEELLGCGKELRIVVTVSSGYDHIDLEAAEKLGICVANAPDPIADAVAEHALGLALALLRNIVYGDRYIRAGRWGSGPAPRAMLATMLKGKTAGILGMGRIGLRLARLLGAVGAGRIIYWSRRRKPEAEALGAQYVGLETLFREGDILFITIALAPETRHLVNEERLRLMRRNAVLVNVSRGAVVDEEALLRALREGWIAGAALDVFEQEPLPPDHPLISMENVVLTPHIAGYTWESIREAAILAARHLAEFLEKGWTRNALTSHCSSRGAKAT